jgi:hypothetical protein
MESREYLAKELESTERPETISPVQQPETDSVTTPTFRLLEHEESSSPDSSDFSTDTSRSSPEPSPFYLPQAWTYPVWTDSPLLSPPRQPARPSAQPRRLAARAPVPRIQVFGDVALVDGEYEEILLRPSLLVDAEEYDRQARAFVAQQRRIYPDKELPKVPIHPHARRRRAIPQPSAEDKSEKYCDNQVDAQDETSTAPSECASSSPGSSHATIVPHGVRRELEHQSLQSTDSVTHSLVTQSHDAVPADQWDVDPTI